MFEQTTLTGRIPAETPGSWPELKALVATLFWKGAVLVVVGTWTVFWGLVIRLHLAQEAFLSGIVVGLLFVVPAIVGIIAYFEPLPDPQQLAPT